ncbi:MAG: adenosylcobinamide-phosphate synthase CbiB [bacterium]
MIERINIVILAYILDLIFGDPGWLPHPVKGIGFTAGKLEPVMRKLIKNEKTAGVIFNILIAGGVYLSVYFIDKYLYSINKNLGLVFSVFCVYTALSIKDLKDESMSVYDELENNNIKSARERLGKIVGRDTGNLDEKEIIRAAVETVSENIVDGIISPLFYAFIGGAPLALAYKAVNTLDSMVGYKNERYRDFGWFSARVDDAANYIPARLSLLFLPLAGFLAGKNMFNSWKIIRRDGDKNPSPNSGIPEAAVAGALGVRLGGANFYNSVSITKPFIGDGINSLDKKHIKESIFIAYISSGLFLSCGLFLLWILKK